MSEFQDLRVKVGPQSIPFRFSGPGASHTELYLWQPVLDILASHDCKRVFDLGCGNGAFARHLKAHGYEVSGVDPSAQGVAHAKSADPELDVEIASAYDPLYERFGKFPAVVSLEVIGHITHPRQYAQCVEDLLEPGGVAVISTPYHGYLKNLLIALTGRSDRHFSPLDEQGFIKLWSIDSLKKLFAGTSLAHERTVLVGRLPFVAKSMILVFRSADRSPLAAAR